MDYSRIYAEFIADRSHHDPQGYVERHHILPRSLGGGDEAQNLVSLSPEDHFFAHLLLAKIHGRSQWNAIIVMASEAWTRRGVTTAMVARMRRHYGAARRALAREGNNKFNPTVFDWVSLDTGETRSAVIYDMHKEFGGCRAHWTSAATGARNTMRGWKIAGRYVRIRGNKGKRFDFLNRDGRTFAGTQGEFASAHGVNLATASRVVRHDSVTRCGWRRMGVSDRPHNYAKDGKPSRASR